MKSVVRSKPGSQWKHFDNRQRNWPQLLCQGSLVVFAIVWLLAVVKVFLLENRHYPQLIKADDVSRELSIVAALPNSKSKFITKTDSYTAQTNHRHIETTEEAQKIKLPTSSEWDFIRSEAAYKVVKENPIMSATHQISSTSGLIASGQLVREVTAQVSHGVDVVHTKEMYELEWPPVLQDGTIRPEDGTDVMPLTGLKVPRFWKPTPNTDVLEIGSRVNGQETIFLMIASYRDFQCRETITSAYNKADHPERLYVGAVDQTVPGDIGCLDIDVPCDVNPNQAICKYRDQISIFHMDAQYATGPVTARHVGDRMYRGQYFVMQMDAHCLFVRHWDSQIINQWQLTGNEMAVLSSYLTDIQGSIDGNGDSTRTSRPIMCNSDFEGMMPARYLRHGSQPEEDAVIRTMPMLQPFWAAGFSFSRGHFKVQVPYDGYQPMVFQGEEIAIGIRGFTFGYDFYAPRDSVVFHEYAEKSSRRKKIHMFWENSQAHAGEGQKSLKRSMSIVGMAPDINPSEWDHTNEDLYGLGKERPLDLFYKLFLIDTKERKATQLCPFVRSGKMHRDFQKYLRSNGRGIDYSNLVNYNSRVRMNGLKD